MSRDGDFEHEQKKQARCETSQLRDKTGPGGVTKVGLQVYEIFDTGTQGQTEGTQTGIVQ